MRIGVAKEIKPDEYRIALTPAGRARADQSRARGRDRAGRRSRQRVPGRGVHPGRRRDRLGRRRLAAQRPGAEGEGADRGRVSAPARGPHPLHVPAHRGRRAVDARADRLGDHRGRVRDGRGGAIAAAARTDVGGCGPACAAGRRLPPREAGRRARAPARRCARGRAGARRGRRRRCRRLQRRGDRTRARRSGDDPRAFDRPHAPSRGGALGPCLAADELEPAGRRVRRGGRPGDRRRVDPRRRRTRSS